jgi:hypothetical protein
MEIGPVQQKIAGAMFLVLVVCLSLMTYTLYKSKKAEFPPIVNQCPDFYTLKGTTCMRPSSYNTNAPATLDIGEGSVYNDKNANSKCKKKRWAKDNSVTWDGITNNESIIPC